MLRTQQKKPMVRNPIQNITILGEGVREVLRTAAQRPGHVGLEAAGLLGADLGEVAGEEPLPQGVEARGQPHRPRGAFGHRHPKCLGGDIHLVTREGRTREERRKGYTSPEIFTA